MTKTKSTRWVSQIERIILDCSNPRYSEATNADTRERAEGWLRSIVNGETLSDARAANLVQTINKRLTPRKALVHSGPIVPTESQVRSAKADYPQLLKSAANVKLGDYVSRADHEAAIQALQAQINALVHLVSGSGLATPETPTEAHETETGAYVPNDAGRAHRASTGQSHDISLWKGKGKIYGNVRLNGVRYCIQVGKLDTELRKIANNSRDPEWATAMEDASNEIYPSDTNKFRVSALYAETDKFAEHAPVREDAAVFFDWDGEQITGSTLMIGQTPIVFTQSTKGTAKTFWKGYAS